MALYKVWLRERAIRDICVIVDCQHADDVEAMAEMGMPQWKEVVSADEPEYDWEAVDCELVSLLVAAVGEEDEG